MIVADSKGCNIRKGVTADATVLAKFSSRVFQEAFGADNRPDDMRAHLAATFGVRQQTSELNDPAAITLLAEHEGTLIAYALVRRSTPPRCVTHASPVELHRFYVDRPYHGKGVAQLLMAAVNQAAYELHGKYIWLSTWERNLRAIAFYTKAGFTDAGTADFFVGSDRQRDRILVAEVEQIIDHR